MTPREWLREIADVMAAVGYSALAERQFRDGFDTVAFCQSATAAEILASMLARSAHREHYGSSGTDADCSGRAILETVEDLPPLTAEQLAEIIAQLEAR